MLYKYTIMTTLLQYSGVLVVKEADVCPDGHMFQSTGPKGAGLGNIPAHCPLLTMVDGLNAVVWLCVRGGV